MHGRSKGATIVWSVALVVSALISAFLVGRATSPTVPDVQEVLALTKVSPSTLEGQVQRHRVYTHHLYRLRAAASLREVSCREALAVRAHWIKYHVLKHIWRTPQRAWSWRSQIIGVTYGKLSGLFSAYHASTSHRGAIQTTYGRYYGDCAVSGGTAWFHVMNFGRL